MSNSNENQEIVNHQEEQENIEAHRQKMIKEMEVAVSNFDKEGMDNLLFEAASRNYILIVKTLLNYGANINAKNKKYGATPLHLAVEHGSLEVVYHLLERGAKLEEKDNEGLNAIHYGAIGGRVEAIRILLHKGGDIRREDKNGMRPIHYAAYCGRRAAIDFLLNTQDESGNKADINSIEKDGKTPLYLAIEQHLNPQIMRDILDVTIEKLEDTIDYLITHGAQMNLLEGDEEKFKDDAMFLKVQAAIK